MDFKKIKDLAKTAVDKTADRSEPDQSTAIAEFNC